ncbi:hypothetical protein FIBSPDRAFT_851537 [Athelia psychrophila]|uniref:Uncharacterized protein n=1 Tax=Athelia psychrophila TaxID=1759441 RepID=A0A166SLJ5_9AGAM|nr:hypothetical protein FIBSPDRAFT_851537 [Fibularhizoctonia sp. CBS 109695]
MGGPVTYGLCQTGEYTIAWMRDRRRLLLVGCNSLAVACYATAGFTFGVTVHHCRDAPCDHCVQ